MPTDTAGQDQPMSDRERIDDLLEVVYDGLDGGCVAARDQLASFLGHIGFDIGAVRDARDLLAALPAFYRLSPGRYDVARLEADLITWPPIAAAVEEQARTLGKPFELPRRGGVKGPAGWQPRTERRGVKRTGRSRQRRKMMTSETSRQMICDRAAQIDIRAYGKHPPRHLEWRGRPVRITSTPCNFGGERYWFICPRCERRCAILYPRLCRTCSGGRYESESASSSDRRLNRAFAIRRKLGQKTHGTGVVAPFPAKPPRMRWHTYLRLRATGLEIERQIWAAAAKNLGMTGEGEDHS